MSCSLSNSRETFCQLNIIDFAGLTPLGDTALLLALQHLFDQNDAIIIVPPLSATAGTDETGNMLQEMFALDGVTHVVIPLLFGSNHWCCLVAHLSNREIQYYDPMGPSYT